MDDAVEQTLHISRTVDVFQIPPRAPTGWRSGEWLVSNKIFSGRLRVVSSGLDCEVRIEDPNTDQLFAACPVKYGMRTICVEPVVDSSRYFVLRVEDPTTKRHAFLGMGFAERGEAFDFNDALIRHEKFVEREKASTQLASSDNQTKGTTSGSSKASSIQAATASKEMAVLYKNHGDLSLKEGQTIHVTVKSNKAPGTTNSWLHNNGSAGLPPPPVAQSSPGLFKLAPPPGSAPLQSPPPPITNPVASSFPHPNGNMHSIDLLDMNAAPSAPPAHTPQQHFGQIQPAATGFGDDADWAVFK